MINQKIHFIIQSFKFGQKIEKKRENKEVNFKRLVEKNLFVTKRETKK